MRSVENEEYGKRGVWKMRSVQNEEYGKCGVWKMRSIACGNALTFLFNIKNALKWFTLDNWKTKTFLVYDENGEENVHYFTTRQKHLSKRKKTLPVLTTHRTLACTLARMRLNVLRKSLVVAP